LTAEEVQAFQVVMQRQGLHNPATVTIREAFDLWLQSYFKYDLNGTHRLDYKRDRQRHYNLDLVRSKEELEARLQKMTRSELEGYAEVVFFCIIGCIEKLEKFKGGKIQLSTKQRPSVSLRCAEIMFGELSKPKLAQT
jgi:hypothetical protein